jgi:triosephosphate isomerase
MSRTKIVAGNWKMNLVSQEAKDLVNQLIELCKPLADNPKVRIILAPASVYLSSVFTQVEDHPHFSVSAQNLHEGDQGAFTGEISGSMIRSTGASFVLVGHSERRTLFGETDSTLAAKTNAAIRNGLSPIFCIGESLEERENEKTFDILQSQLMNGLFHLSLSEMAGVIIAYEPVWAIGTGKTASPEQAQEVHAFIRRLLTEKYGELAQRIPILYGGSVNPGNAETLFACPDIDGGLVGGASLKAQDFHAIIKAMYKG